MEEGEKEEFGKQYREALSKFLSEVGNIDGEVFVKKDMTEEEILEELTIKEEKGYPLSFFIQIGRNLLKDERYLLVKIVDAFIKDNFNVKVTTKNNITTYYEID